MANSLLFLTTDLSCLTASMTSHTCLREAGSRPVVGLSEGREGGREGREGKELHLIAAELHLLAVNFKACDMQLSYTNLRPH